MIKFENILEEKIINHPLWIEGVRYGKPRKGHPEGEVYYHIIEVLKNVDKYAQNDEIRSNLRLIALIHDTFKFKVDRTKAKVGENHHGMIARRFAESIGIEDKSILDVIELHDEAYLAWCKLNFERLDKLIERLKENNATDLYIKFYKCDNETGDKEQENFYWFCNFLNIKKEVEENATDL